MLKQIFKDKLSRSAYGLAAREAQIHKNLHHPNIVKLVSHRETDSCFELILERCNDPLYFEEKVYDVSGIFWLSVIIRDLPSLNQKRKLRVSQEKSYSALSTYTRRK